MNKNNQWLLGAGSWGTAVAIHLAKLGHRILLWGHNSQHVALMAKQRANVSYLPEYYFPDNLFPVSDLRQCTLEADYILIAVPSHAFAALVTKIEQPPQWFSLAY